MPTKISLLALAVALIAVGVAAYDRTQERVEPSFPEARITALEDQVARLARAVEEGNVRLVEVRERAADPGRSLRKLDPSDIEAYGDAGSVANPEETLQALVDEAVTKKTREVVDKLAAKQDKKPTMDVFAATLELTPEQRRLAEQEVIRTQGELRAILEIQAPDGTNFMDELVEVVAKSMAEPGEDPGWAKFVYGLTTQKIPGTNDTFATRIEAAKESLRESFRRDWSEEQYAEFESWRMDPTEIRNIEGSPYKDLERRIIDRAVQLGAEIPGEEDR